MNPVKHVAIIMDGNGRWGLKHKKSRNLGHKEGLKTVEKIIESLADGYYKRNVSKPKNKKTLRKKKKTIEEIFENLIYD